MNLILCDKDCAHQQDGYCQLETMTPLTASKEDGCYYFCGRAPLCQTDGQEYPAKQGGDPQV